MFKELGSEVVRIYRGMAVVKRWGQYRDRDGNLDGDTKVYFDLCAYDDGVGGAFASFVSLRAALKRLFGF